jgi:hypothetical protein
VRITPAMPIAGNAVSALALLLVEGLRFLHKETPPTLECFGGKGSWAELADQVCPQPVDPVCHCPEPSPVIVVPATAFWIPLLGIVVGHLLLALVRCGYERCSAGRVVRTPSRQTPTRRGGGVLD